MLKLSKKSFKLVQQYMENNARALEKSLFNYYFNDDNSEGVIEELQKYQNDDGGFGNALEPDFRLPSSSPMATSIGLRLISDVNGLKHAEGIVKYAVNYLESAYNEERRGWFAVTQEVNDYPHTPWWHFDKEQGMTIIDKNWGNPSAELLAYLYKYRDFVNKLDINYLVDYALHYIENKKKFNSENELFCYIKLYEVLPDKFKNRLRRPITHGISQVIENKKGKWLEYVPQPLDFVPGPNKCKFGISKVKIKENINFYVNLIENKGIIDPPWGESFYQDDLSPAFDEWRGILSLKVLKRLDNYHRLE